MFAALSCWVAKLRNTTTDDRQKRDFTAKSAKGAEMYDRSAFTLSPYSLTTLPSREAMGMKTCDPLSRPSGCATTGPYSCVAPPFSLSTSQ